MKLLFCSVIIKTDLYTSKLATPNNHSASFGFTEVSTVFMDLFISNCDVSLGFVCDCSIRMSSF